MQPRNRLLSPFRAASMGVAFAALIVPMARAHAAAQERQIFMHPRPEVITVPLGGGYIGIDVLPLTPELRVHFGVAEDAGVLVSHLEPGGPGEVAGIRVGDVLTGVDGEPVTNTNRLVRAIRTKDAGEGVTIELWRDGSMQSVPVVVAERERRVFDFARVLPGEPGELAREMQGFAYLAPGLALDEETRDALESAMNELEKRFESGEWREKLDRIEKLDFSAIQERMREVEERLRELERELAKEREPQR